MTKMTLLTAAGTLMATLWLGLWLLQRRLNAGMKRLKQATRRLEALSEPRAAPLRGVDEERHMALRGAVNDVVLATHAAERKGWQPAVYSALTLAVLVSLAATAMAQWDPAPPQFGAHGAAGSLTAPPIAHGADMQVAIAKLADKLREHPGDAHGWALLGRTYKALGQYPQARDAFGHAAVAAPADVELAREYAAADSPNPEPPLTRVMPQACTVSKLECSLEAVDVAYSATRADMAAKTRNDAGRMDRPVH